MGGGGGGGVGGGILNFFFSQKVKMNAYAVLECDVKSTQEEIKLAYHRLLLIHHPVKQQSTSHTQIDNFVRLQSAFKILNDPSQRKSYDSLLKQIELTQKSSSSSFDEFCMLNKDFSLESGLFTKHCRCGSFYKLFSEQVNDLLVASSSAESLVLLIECDTCSLNINVLLI